MDNVYSKTKTNCQHCIAASGRHFTPVEFSSCAAVSNAYSLAAIYGHPLLMHLLRMRTNLFQHLLLLTVLTTAACSYQPVKKADDTELRTFFNPIKLDSTNQKSNLRIEAIFSECGEWSGHRENIIISADKDERVFATYQVFPYNCDSLDYYYGNLNISPVSVKKFLLSDSAKKSIVSYLHRMIKSKVSETFPGHAGNLFSAVNSDSSLMIQVYDNKEFDIDSFRQLVAELNK